MVIAASLLHRKGKKYWIAWRNPKQCLLPKDGEPKTNIKLQTGTKAVTIEHVITGMGQKTAKRKRVSCVNGTVNLTLTHTSVYIFPE